MSFILRDTRYNGGPSLIFDNVVFLAPVNRAPVFTSAAALTVSQNDTGTHTLTATDADSDALTYAVVGSWPAWATLAADVITLAPGVDITPADYALTVSVYDGVATVEQVITVTVALAFWGYVPPINRIVRFF